MFAKVPAISSQSAHTRVVKCGTSVAGICLACSCDVFIQNKKTKTKTKKQRKKQTNQTKQNKLCGKVHRTKVRNCTPALCYQKQANCGLHTYDNILLSKANSNFLAFSLHCLRDITTTNILSYYCLLLTHRHAGY